MLSGNVCVLLGVEKGVGWSGRVAVRGGGGANPASPCFRCSWVLESAVMAGRGGRGGDPGEAWWWVQLEVGGGVRVGLGTQ